MTYEYLTDEQVAEVVHGKVGTIKKKLAAGEIRSALIMGRRLVRRDWLDAYIEAKAEGGRNRLRRAS